VQRGEHDGLVLHGAQSDVDTYISALVGAGLQLRGLELTETPLEALFFMLTESAPGGVPHELDHDRLTGAAR
jgi:ABC-2 type transport system ATP-binding protein